MDTAPRSDMTDALYQVVEEAESLLHALADDPDGRLAALRERVQGTVDAARARLAEMQTTAERPLERAASATEQWVQENPWTTVALCAGVGIAIGMLLARRTGRPARAADERDAQ